MPGRYQFGGWYATSIFADLPFGLDPVGMQVSLASPASAFPLMHQGNWGIYGVADQMIWRAQKGPQSLNAFPRRASPADRNLVMSYIDAVSTQRRSGRDDDVLTFGFAYRRSARMPPPSIAYPAFTGASFRCATGVVLELDYSLQLAPW